MLSIATWLIFLWTLVAVPVFCPAGIVQHGCPGDELPSCEHEDDCAVDPCTFASAISAERNVRLSADTDTPFMPPVSFGDLPSTEWSGSPGVEHMTSGTPSRTTATSLPLLI